jgi:hypothetical protein
VEIGANVRASNVFTVRMVSSPAAFNARKERRQQVCGQDSRVTSSSQYPRSTKRLSGVAIVTAQRAE